MQWIWCAVTEDRSRQDAFEQARTRLEQCLELLDPFGDSIAAAHINAALQAIAREIA